VYPARKTSTLANGSIYCRIRQQVAAYKRFKKLVKKRTELAIAHSKLTIDIAKKKGSK